MPYQYITSVASLIPGEKLTSLNGMYELVFQYDGNIVGYTDASSMFWATWTSNQGIPPKRVLMQEDGNVVLYDDSDIPLWSTGTGNQGTGPFRLVMQDDRNVVLYDVNNQVLWDSGTIV